MTTPTGGNVLGDATITVSANTTAALRDLNQFSRDAQGRIRDVRGRFVSEGRLINGTLTRVTGEMGRASQAMGGMAGSAGVLAPALKGVAVVAGASLLPALGAVVPMAAGVALAAGTLKIAFSGVGDAVAAAGEDQEKYKEALKELSPPQRAFAKELVATKKAFAPFAKEIQKAALPGFTQALKDARPVIKIVGQAMTDMAEGFGDAAREAGRFMKESGFRDALQTNLKLGTGFVKDMTASLGPFTKSLLDFGAASGPTLKAFSDGIGGLLTKGLPGFFEGLTPGIGGAAKGLDGLFDAVNRLLPAFGRLSGEIARVAGPVVGEIFRSLGIVGAGAMDAFRGAVTLVAPVVKDLGFGLKTVIDIGKTVAPTMKDTALAIINAFSGVGGSVDKAVGPLQRLNQFVNENKVGILEASRVFGVAMIDMTGAAIAFSPKVVEAFKAVSIAILSSIDGIIVGAEAAFGWLPGVGDKVKDAAGKFKEFKDSFIGNLDDAQKRGEEFAAQALPKLEQGKLKLNISNWQEQIATAKRQMKTVPPEKQAALKAKISDLEAKVRRAKDALAGVRGKTVYVNSYFTSIYRVKRLQPGDKGYGVVSPALGGATGGLYTGSDFKFRGKGYATGGLVDGPGTETSDSVFAPWLSKNEFVVNAKQTAQHLPLLKAINSGQMGMATGGMVGAGTEVGAGLAAGLGAAVKSVMEAARMLAAAVLTGVRDELQIASPSKAMKALAKDVGKGFIVGLTGSRDKIKAVSKDLAADVRAAFSGRRESALIKLINRDTGKLLSLASKRDSVVKRIADANKFASDTAGTARATGSLASIIRPDAFSPTFVKREMQASLNSIKSFTANVQKLQKKGLNKNLLRQILEMGPEQGGAFAKSLAGADAATIKQYNKLQADIDKQSTKLGKVGADMLFDSGRQAGRGFLTGLKAQQKDIEKLMLSIAKGMQRSIRKALGISSPARKLIPDGVNTARGLALGVVRGLPHIDSAMQQVTSRVTSGARMPAVGTVPTTRPSARPAASSGDLHVHLHLQNHGVIGSQRQMDDWFAHALDTAVRTGRIPVAMRRAISNVR